MRTRNVGSLIAATVAMVVAGTSAQGAALPDLKINAMYLAKWTQPPVSAYQPVPASILTGTKVFLVCEVINAGTANVVGNYFVSFRVDGAEVGSQLIENAPQPGLLRKPGTAWTAGVIGPHTFTCSIDPFPSRQLESNEQNNEASIPFRVGMRPILVPKAISNPAPHR